jgi:hypothetical protein
MTTQEIKQYFDVYGYSVIATSLKKNYLFVSFSKNSIPTQGSMTLPISKLNTESDAKIENVIIHKNNKLTIKTNYGFMQFFN